MKAARLINIQNGMKNQGWDNERQRDHIQEQGHF